MTEYIWWADTNLDPFFAVLHIHSYSKDALNKSIARLTEAGWQLEHYHGPLGAVFIR